MHGSTVKRSDKHSKQKEPKQRQNEKWRTYSFFATLVIIAIVVGASVISSFPHVEHIPETFEFNDQPWMKYIPNAVEYVLYVNFDSAIALAGSPQLFGTEPLVGLYQLNFSLYPRDVVFEIDIQLPAPQYGGTVSVMKLHDQRMTALQNSVERATNAPHWPYQGYTIHGLLMKKATDQKLQQGFISLVGGYVILSNDQAKGREEVQRVLDQFAFTAPSLFDDITVKRGMYAAGVTNQQFVALYVGMFQTQLNYSRMIVKSVVQDGNGMLVTRSILFPSDDVALNQFGEAHRIYRDAAIYRILDSWLVVGYRYHVDRLRAELSGI